MFAKAFGLRYEDPIDVSLMLNIGDWEKSSVTERGISQLRVCMSFGDKTRKADRRALAIVTAVVATAARLAGLRFLGSVAHQGHA